MSELAKLKQSLASLEAILETLDELGAGIAAIHVDAAINQLKSNLEVVTDECLTAVLSMPSCPSEHPVGLP